MTTPAIIATLAVAILGAALSVFVVLKRLAFIGQGVSHAAFGGVGIALVLGIHAATTAGLLGQMSIVLVFSVGAALLISALSRAQRGRTDTAIGLVLTVPSGLSESGLPVGISISAPHHCEASLLQIGKLLEKQGLTFIPPTQFE